MDLEKIISQMTRGIEGVRIGFWNNDKFREYMEKAKNSAKKYDEL